MFLPCPVNVTPQHCGIVPPDTVETTDLDTKDLFDSNFMSLNIDSIFNRLITSTAKKLN